MIKAKTIIDHLNAIYTNQSLNYFDELNDADKRTYSSYMINRFISMNPDYLNVVNSFQMYIPSDSRTSYLFYSQLLPKKKQFYRYIKAIKSDKFEQWLIDLFGEHFQVSLSEAEYYLSIMSKTKDGQIEIKTICEENAVDPSIIDKLKF